MPDKTFMVRMKAPNHATQHVVAVSAGIHGEH
jgi:hypothetical protein